VDVASYRMEIVRATSSTHGHACNTSTQTCACIMHMYASASSHSVCAHHVHAPAPMHPCTCTFTCTRAHAMGHLCEFPMPPCVHTPCTCTCAFMLRARLCATLDFFTLRSAYASLISSPTVNCVSVLVHESVSVPMCEFVCARVVCLS
jgi:hypothetical protein